MERWLPIPGFESVYMVSSLGRVRSVDRIVPTKRGQRRYRGRVLNPTLRPDGRLVVNLSSRIRLVHRLVLEAFVGACPAGQVCRHFPDPNPANNHLSNLSWGTQAENMADRVVHGTDSRGEDRPLSKLTEGDVVQIRGLLEEGVTQSTIAQRFRVCQATISKIARGVVWSHVAKGATLHLPDTHSRGSRRYNAKLREVDIPVIRAALDAGRTQKAIAQEYGVDPRTIWSIKHRKRWAHVP